MARTNPVSSYGPELLALLRKGSMERITIKLPPERGGWAKGKMLQHRIHSLRGALKRETHPLYEIASRARTSLLWGDKLQPPRNEPWKWDKAARNKLPENRACYSELTIDPNDSEFTQSILDAGVTLDPAAPPAPQSVTSLPDDEDLLDQILSGDKP